ncbi:hypothetical protein LX64_01338 [Chitinophaga skermanii]|uniref:Uncharacterized protein n=1 Tax=Chitinophaga skermanii TaxID=331697 RepID=A0A327QY85_9BACT|nr:hypothetical protein [Chitinophaga skermanii]RAJ08684.1 hypothetical protein LX64_01338 [Chitinophaga skermanii]
MLGKILSRIQMRSVSGGQSYRGIQCDYYVARCNNLSCPPFDCFCGKMADTGQLYCKTVDPL